MKSILIQAVQTTRFQQFAKFCLVGASGLVVDMVVLHCLVKWLGWNVILGKACSSEMAMLSNFFLNESWTFRSFGRDVVSGSNLLLRLLRFQVICGAGIALAMVLLNLFYRYLGVNLYAANLLAILLVTFWNFWMNALFNWGGDRKSKGSAALQNPPPVAVRRAEDP